MLTRPDVSLPMCRAAGAYVQWRARAIGEKSSAAEAKLEKAGPYEGMTVRRAMATVLRVLKDVLGDDFCIDRLEMVCVDIVCEDEDEALDETIQAEGGKHRWDMSRSADDVEARSPPTTSSQDSTSSSRRNIYSSSGNSHRAGASDRESGGRGAGGPSRAKNGSPGAPSVPLQYGLFRRVSKSEMEKLLVEEEPATTQLPAE